MNISTDEFIESYFIIRERVRASKSIKVIDKEETELFDNDGWTYLHYAAIWNHKEMLDALLIAGADPRAQFSPKTETPLSLAEMYNHLYCIEQLQTAIDKQPKLKQKNHQRSHSVDSFFYRGKKQDALGNTERDIDFCTQL